MKKLRQTALHQQDKKSQAGNYWDTFLNLDLNYDKRNQKYKTSDGFRSFYAVNLPIISENNSLTNAYVFTFMMNYIKIMLQNFLFLQNHLPH